MKKFMSLVLVALLVLSCFVFASCSSNERPAGLANDVSGKEEIKIGIIQYMPHPSLDNCTAGIMQALEGSDLADKLDIDVQIGSSASADSDCDTYASQMVAKKYDMIFAVATPAALSAFAATESIPVIFCAVSDPVAAGIVKSAEEPYYNITGTSDVLDLSAQLDLIQSMQPDVKKIGILYTTSEANSISNLARMKELAEARGLTIEASGVQNASDISTAATELVAKVDCLNNFTDNNVVDNLPIVLEAANRAGIPIYGSEIEQVKNGCLAAVSIDYVALGVATGEMGLEVLGGASIGKIAVKTITDATPVINSEVVSALNMTVPESYVNAEFVTTNK